MFDMKMLAKFLKKKGHLVIEPTFSKKTFEYSENISTKSEYFAGRLQKLSIFNASLKESNMKLNF